MRQHQYTISIRVLAGHPGGETTKLVGWNDETIGPFTSFVEAMAAADAAERAAVAEAVRRQGRGP